MLTFLLSSKNLDCVFVKVKHEMRELIEQHGNLTVSVSRHCYDQTCSHSPNFSLTLDILEVVCCTIPCEQLVSFT